VRTLMRIEAAVAATLAVGCGHGPEWIGSAGLQTSELRLVGTIQSNGARVIGTMPLIHAVEFDPVHLTGGDELWLGLVGGESAPMSWIDDRGYAQLALDPAPPDVNALQLDVVRGGERGDASIPLNFPPQAPLTGPAGPVSRSEPFGVAWGRSPLERGDQLAVRVDSDCLDLPLERRLERDDGRFELQPADLADLFVADGAVDCTMYVSVKRTRVVSSSCSTEACVSDSSIPLEQVRTVAVDTVP